VRQHPDDADDEADALSKTTQHGDAPAKSKRYKGHVWLTVWRSRSCLRPCCCCVLQNSEIIKRWVNEVQEAVQSKHSMVQFHAVALLHALRYAHGPALGVSINQFTTRYSRRFSVMARLRVSREIQVHKEHHQTIEQNRPPGVGVWRW
jgi:hypothetical protein